MRAYFDPVYTEPVYTGTRCVAPAYGAKASFEVAQPQALTKMLVVGIPELHPEQAAVARTLAGDLNAFNELVVRFQGVAYSVAYRMLQSREEASDAVQESFVKAYRALPSFRNGSGSFKSWLLRIVVNRCHDLLRLWRRLEVVAIHDDARYESAADSEKSSSYQLVDAQESPQAYVERMELSAQIERGLRALPLEQRLVLALYDIHGYSYEEICEITGWPMGTVKSRINRARVKLRDFLVREPDLLPVRLSS